LAGVDKIPLTLFLGRVALEKMCLNRSLPIGIGFWASDFLLGAQA
jgi:hypothetical protein